MEGIKSRHVAIVDFISAGHHGTWLKEFIKCLLHQGHRVSVFYPDENELNNWIKNNLGEYSSSFSSHEISESPPSKSRFGVLQKWMQVKKIIRREKIKPDLVFFAWVDDFRFRKDHPLLDRLYLKWVEWFFPYKWSGLYFHPVHLRLPDLHRYPGYDIDDIFKLKNCSSVCILDKEIQGRLSKKIPKRVIRFPDFTDDTVNQSSLPATKLKEVANGRKIILLAGALMKRKGIFTLMETAKQSIDHPWLFAMAGNIFRDDFSESELKQIDLLVTHPQPNIWLCDQHLSEPDFNALVNTCDILYAAYIRFPHTSNMLNKASIFHKPLIVARGFYMDEVVNSLKIGEVINESNSSEAKQAIEKIFATGGYINNQSLKGFETYRRENSIEKLCGGFEEVLQALI